MPNLRFFDRNRGLVSCVLALAGPALIAAACSDGNGANDQTPSPPGNDAGIGNGDDAGQDGGAELPDANPAEDGGPLDGGVVVPVGTATRIVGSASDFLVTDRWSGEDRRIEATAERAIAHHSRRHRLHGWGSDDDHGISRIAVTTTNGTPTSVAWLNPRGTYLAFAGPRMFALDYGDPVPIGNDRNSGLWFYEGDRGTKVAQINLGVFSSRASLTVYDNGIYVRVGSVVRYDAATATTGSKGVTIVPSAECPSAGSQADDVLAVDASGIYVACAETAEYQIRKYSPTGTLQKIVGSSPRGSSGFIFRLRLTATHAYWLGEESRLMGIYRAEK